jgi:hypothetical protein
MPRDSSLSLARSSLWAYGSYAERRQSLHLRSLAWRLVPRTLHRLPQFLPNKALSAIGGIRQPNGRFGLLLRSGYTSHYPSREGRQLSFVVRRHRSESVDG